MLSTKTTSFTYHYCETDGNFTTNSTYRTNLDTALSTLPTTNTGLGFFNQSIGQGGDRVYTSALCRGDINPDACDSCLNNSLVNLREMCPNQKGAVGYHDACWLYYSNKTIFGNTSSGSIILYNTQNASDRDRFTVAPGPLLNKLIVEAAAGGLLRKFASSNTTEPGSNITIYGLVQCIPDLTGPQCSDCLKNAVDVFVSRVSWSIGGRLLQPKCNFRYESYPFFNSSTPVTSPPSPPPQAVNGASTDEANGGVRRSSLKDGVRSLHDITAGGCIRHRRTERRLRMKGRKSSTHRCLRMGGELLDMR